MVFVFENSRKHRTVATLIRHRNAKTVRNYDLEQSIGQDSFRKYCLESAGTAANTIACR
jgi:hypothetical protein